MVRGARPTRFTGSALIRLLARLGEADVPESKQTVAERLSHWFGWTDAVSLSTALSGHATAPSDACVSASAEESECVRVRHALVNAIEDDGASGSVKGGVNQRSSMRDASKATATDFSPYRQSYHARQQAMEAGIGLLRDRLRTVLAAKSPGMARLAAVDAVMEQVLGARERALLFTVPTLLEKHFRRLRQADEAARADEREPGYPGDDEAGPAEWLDAFRKDMRSVLLAELEIRFQPVEGLLEALRMK